MLQNVTQGLGRGQMFWNDLSKGKWTRGLAHGMYDTDRGEGRRWHLEGNYQNIGLI
jgi:hypothetical protein